MLKKIIHILFIATFFTSCNSQNTNPIHIGDSILDLDKITFNESIDTLFSLVEHRKLPITDKHYDKEKKETVVTDTLAFDIRISKKTPNQPLFYFVDSEFSQNYLVHFITDKKNDFKAFSFFDSRKEPYNGILKKVQEKYGKYQVKLKTNKLLEKFHTEAYQWELENRIIVMYQSTKLINEEYTCGISVLKKSNDLTSFPINQFIYGSEFCLDKSCKE